MAVRQGHIEYGPFEVISGGMPLTHGIFPSAARLVCQPFLASYRRRYPLILHFSGTRLVFRNALLRDVHFSTDQQGFTTLILTVEDRRWVWKKYGRIRGSYNLREGDGRVRVSRIKRPHDLARLCLQAMGEKRWNIKALPNDELPEVLWDGLPAEMLARLCDQLGCRVGLDPITDLATVWKAGIGKPLPVGQDVLSATITAEPPEVPDEIKFLGGRTLRQWALELEPLAQDDDDAAKPLEEVSYKPKEGWRKVLPPDFIKVDEKHRDRAKASVFKWWRPKIPQQVGNVEIKKLSQILPLDNRLVQVTPVDILKQKESVEKKDTKKQDINAKTFERQPAFVYGDFYDHREAHKDADPNLKTQNGDKTKWEDGVLIDSERGMVITQEHAYRWVDQDGGPVTEKTDPEQRFIAPARLWLVTAVAIRDEETFAWQRFEASLKPKGPKLGTPPFYIERDDVWFGLYWVHKPDDTADLFTNIKEVERQADFYLQQKLRQFQFKDPGAVVKEGWHPISPDGAIQQVSWTLDAQGFATTSVSRNADLIQHADSYDEDRKQQKLSSFFEAWDKLATSGEKKNGIAQLFLPGSSFPV